MKLQFLKNHYLLIALTIAYTYFFWQHSFGINLPIFSAILLIVMYLKFKQSVAKMNSLILLLGTVVSGCMVVITNSDTAVITHIISFYLLVGFVHQQQIRSIVFSLLTMVQTFIYAPRNIIDEYIKSHEHQQAKFTKALYYFKLFFVPIFIVLLFFILYCFANPIFCQISFHAIEVCFNSLDKIFEYISIPQILFSLGGVILIGTVLYKDFTIKYGIEEQQENDKLIRVKQKHFFNKSISALKKEYRIAILLLTSVNLLLIVVNYVDIKCLWFGFNPPNNFCFKDFVHEGTEVLIASIVLAMFIILYFFRMNLNFIPKNKMLVLLANIWLLQNFILTISVALRNYYYINFHALAYKRIGVAFFLILVTVGLVSIFIKVNYRKSGYYLLRMNSWAIYFSIVILSLINWNELIVQYNIKHWSKKDVDVDFYFQLSPNISNYLIDNRAIIQQQIIANQQANHVWLENKSIATFDSTLTIRHTEYLNKIKNDTWQSWNYMDYKYLNQIKNHEAHL